MGDRETLSTMEKPESRTPEDDIARHRKQLAARCPDVDISNVWLVLGVPVTQRIQPAESTVPVVSKFRRISIGVDICIESEMELS